MMQTETTISNIGPVHSAQVIEVIRILVNRGDGTPEAPIRTVVEYWSLDGQLLAEVDTHMSTTTYSFSAPVAESK